MVGPNQPLVSANVFFPDRVNEMIAIVARITVTIMMMK